MREAKRGKVLDDMDAMGKLPPGSSHESLSLKGGSRGLVHDIKQCFVNTLQDFFSFVYCVKLDKFMLLRATTYKHQHALRVVEGSGTIQSVNVHSK
jgi:hypothetical protein